MFGSPLWPRNPGWAKSPSLPESAAESLGVGWRRNGMRDPGADETDRLLGEPRKSLAANGLVCLSTCVRRFPRRATSTYGGGMVLYQSSAAHRIRSLWLAAPRRAGPVKLPR